VAKTNPVALVPEDLALEIKERVLQFVPLYYVSSMDAKGHERIFYGGTFEFKCKVPKKVILNALVKAKVFKGPSALPPPEEEA